MPKKCLSSATKRIHNYPVRLSDIELDWLRIKASDAGMPASELIRRLTLGKPLPKRLSKISQATYIDWTLDKKKWFASITRELKKYASEITPVILETE